MHAIDEIKRVQLNANDQFINILKIKGSLVENPENWTPEVQLEVLDVMLEMTGTMRHLSYVLSIHLAQEAK